MSPKTGIDQENPEWSDADFALSKPGTELPADLLAFFPKTRGPQKAPTKIPVSLRLSPEVVEYFKATGPGWQSRIDSELRKIAGL
ncbi:BrnA antitoxin family protein [Rhizobium sp. RU36D]|uniref:BrnA antitoxin family protein n=1 Tax=Rhizobium sp. RU36D TaxID=1907415 RepID=UPI0009D88154|nr:BrnA antitoxin family protein [Rhizobium sp. RU36D]SMC91667.1 Uncharacterized conserved protein, DUF4415 family [Rhizobium sp. RU36D]